MKLDIVNFAYRILEMQDKIIELEIENNRLRKYEADYNELLNSSMKHNATMMGNILELCMTPGVVEACENNKTFGDR
jgi:hypothetical protein